MPYPMAAARPHNNSQSVIDILRASLLTEYRFNEGAGQQIFNRVLNPSGTPSNNLFGYPEQVFTDTHFWNVSAGVTLTDNFATDPLGGNNATRVVSTAGTRYVYQTTTLGTGAHTVAVWVKSNTGSPQAMRFSLNNTGTLSADIVVPTTWTRVSYTSSPGAGTTGRMVVVSDVAGDALDILIYGATLVTGSSDPGYNAGLTYDATLGSTGAVDSADPAWSTGYLGFQGSKYAVAVPPSPTSTNQISVYVLCRWTGTQVLTGYSAIINEKYTSNKLMLAGDNGGSGLEFQFNANTAPAYLAYLKDAGWCVVSGTYDGTTLRVYVDGTELGSKTQAGLSAISITQLLISNINYVAYWPGDIAYACVYTTGHTASQVIANSAVLRAFGIAKGLTVPGSQRLFIAEGDSITDVLTAVGRGYAFKAIRAGLTTSAMGRNFAVSGSSVSTMVARAASVDALYNSSRSKNILSVLIGRNDLVGASESDTFKAALQSYLQARKAVGWTTLVCTILPSTAANINTRRAEVNTWLKSGLSFVDAVCDFAAEPTMGPDAAASNTTYYSDGTHPTDAGQVLLKVVWKAAIEALL